MCNLPVMDHWDHSVFLQLEVSLAGRILFILFAINTFNIDKNEPDVCSVSNDKLYNDCG